MSKFTEQQRMTLRIVLAKCVELEGSTLLTPYCLMQEYASTDEAKFQRIVNALTEAKCLSKTSDLGLSWYNVTAYGLAVHNRIREQMWQSKHPDLA